MPRSGTSLVEQIISNHSEVHGAGELDLLPISVKDDRNGKTLMIFLWL